MSRNTAYWITFIALGFWAMIFDKDPSSYFAGALIIAYLEKQK